MGVQLQRPAAEGITKVEGAYARNNNTGGVETKFKFLERKGKQGRTAGRPAVTDASFL